MYTSLFPMKKLAGLFALSMVITVLDALAQTPPPCGVAEANEQYYQAYPQARTDKENFEIFTKQYIEQNLQYKTTDDTFVIPVVFHVYGTVQGGKPVNDTIIQTAMKWANDDLNGLNADFGNVHNQFLSLRGTMKIRLALAKKDPNGNPTTGIKYYPVRTGYAKPVGMNADIAADAWDNFKYVNIYVMNDLMGDGITSNSGYAYYPDSMMSVLKTARIVYNGAYLSTNNTTLEFASTLTHEFGHFFNLLHTFEGGCMGVGDQVADTPPCNTGQGCHQSPNNGAPLNCLSQLVNADNYMDYNICYKMFTQGQIERMKAAMQHPARKPLWQTPNLIATGVYIPPPLPNNVMLPAKNDGVSVYPNPTSGKIHIVTGDENKCSVTITDAMGRRIADTSLQPVAGKVQVDITGHPPGMYFLKISSSNSVISYKIQLQ